MGEKGIADLPGIAGLPATAVYSEMRRMGPQVAARRDTTILPLRAPLTCWHLMDWRPNVKSSSHRSLAKMIRSFAKAGFIKLKEQRGEQMILSLSLTCMQRGRQLLQCLE